MNLSLETLIHLVLLFDGLLVDVPFWARTKKLICFMCFHFTVFAIIVIVFVEHHYDLPHSKWLSRIRVVLVMLDSWYPIA